MMAAEAFADMGRTVLDVLRRAGMPMALPEAARRIVALRGAGPVIGRGAGGH